MPYWVIRSILSWSYLFRFWPDPKKIKAVQDWPPPADVKAVRQFLALASYYCRYIPCFAEIANPLHKPTQKGVPFHWTTDCADAYVCLTERCECNRNWDSTGARWPCGCLCDPCLDQLRATIQLIQKECLAAVYATKQFRHYLLWRHFQLVTDHSPLQWLSSQKMEGLLCRWALALQEYDFDIVYRKGLLNSNADTLS